MRFNKTCLLALIVLLAATCGCVSKSESEEAVVYSYQLWAPLLVFVGGMAAVPAGWAMRESSLRGCLVLTLGGPAVMLFFAPSLFFEKLTIDDERLVMRAGMFGLSTENDVRWDDVRSITLTSEESRGRRGRRVIKNYMIFSMKDNSSSKLSLDNSLVGEALEDIGIQIGMRDISVLDNLREN